MRIVIVYCKNCGAEYMWQASGNHWTLDTPKEYNDEEYCPTCKRAIVDALAPIQKKSFIKWVEADDVDLSTIKRWYSEMLEERKVYAGGWPYMKRIFATLPGHDTIHIQGREEYADKFFHCLFNTKTEELISLTTKVRVDMNDEILEYLKD